MRIAVVGDTILDRDVEGRSQRRCPDGDGPVVDVSATRESVGGAGLAALLAVEYGAQVTLITALGSDDSGRRLTELLGQSPLRVVPMPLRGGTSTKTRIRESGVTIARLDTGDGRCEQEAPAAPDLGGFDAVLVSDYGRGAAQSGWIRRWLGSVAAQHVPIVWDPHPRGGCPVAGTTLMTPNAAEAAKSGIAEGLARNVAPTEWGCDAIAVTQGSGGAMLHIGGGAPQSFPVPPSGDSADLDPCGAGDAFAAAATVALADGADASAAVEAAVAAASRMVIGGTRVALSLVTEDVAAVTNSWAADSGGGADAGAVDAGRTQSTRSRIPGRRLVATGGCFDLLHPGHISLLRRARALGDELIVCINSDSSIRRAKGAGRPIVCAADRAQMLRALDCVDEVVVFGEDTPQRVISEIRPDIWVKGSDYSSDGIPEAATVRAYGGEVTILATIPGYSTTGMIATARRSGVSLTAHRAFSRTTHDSERTVIGQ